MSEAVTLALITFVTVLANLAFNAWEAGRKRRAEVEDREWKARQEQHQTATAEKQEALMEQTQALSADVQANTVVSQVAATAAQTGAGAAVKAAAAASGESEHKVLADVKADVNRRLGAVFGPYVGETDGEAAEAEKPGRGNSVRYPR